MPTVVLKLFAVQGTGRTDGQSSDYMLPPLGSIKIMPLYINISFNDKVYRLVHMQCI